MEQKIYQVDAFTDAVFGGNPAAVCPLAKWLPDVLLQQIAMENNLAETAFYVKSDGQYEIRWFTPVVEVDLCGHATLAAAFVLFHQEGHVGDSIRFYSHRSGALIVTRNGDLLTLDFPRDQFEEIPLTEAIRRCFTETPVAAFRGKTDYMIVFETEEEIQHMKPSMAALGELDCRGVIVTAPGKRFDFVSRFFAPQSGIPEDPVTGSAHTTMTPYWVEKLGRKELSAVQLSERKGFLQCRDSGDRVEISGKGKMYMRGEIFVDFPSSHRLRQLQKPVGLR